MKEELISLGFKKREEGFIGIKIQRGVWLELNLKTKRTIIFSSDGKFIQIANAKTINRVKELYLGLTGEELTIKQ